MSNNSKTPIENRNQLIQYFIDGIKKENYQKIGVEHEKFLFGKDDFKRIDYEKVKKVFEILKGKGWEPEYEKDKIKKLRLSLDFNMNYQVHLLKIYIQSVQKIVLISMN